MSSSSGPTSSLAAAVDGLLADTVLGALGPTPSPKRKAPEPAEAGGAEDSAAEALAYEAEAPPAKKARTSERTVNAVATAADPPPTIPAAPPAPDALLLGAAPAPTVDLDAALGELLAEDEEELPSTQPLDSTQPAAASPAPAPAAPTAAPSGPAPCTMQRPASPAAVVMSAGGGQASEATEEAAATDEAAGAEPLPSTQPATQPAAGSCGSAAPGSRPPAAPSAATCPTAVVLAAIAAPGAAPNAAVPAPTATAAASPACPAHHHSPTTHCPPPTAHHHLPTTTLPTTKPPTTTLSLPLASAAAAAPPTAPPAAAAGDAACAAAATAASADHTCLEPPAATAHINLLKPGVPADSQSSGYSGSCGAGGWTDSSSEEAELPLAEPEEPAASPTKLVQYGDYRVEGHRVGSGGLGVVYPATHGPSGLEVALKLGGCFAPELREHDFVWATFKTEWDTYEALGGRGLHWVAEAFEYGLIQTGTGVAPWITMELLGPSLHSLAQRHMHAARKSGGTAHSGGLPHLGAYARGMLAALEGLHAQGLIHNDVKPANFTVVRGFDPASLVSGSGSGGDPRIFLIDFGFTLRWAPEKAGEPLDFVGTPDFAASTVLLSQRPGARDDLEALGYALLDLALGEIPWDVTKLEEGEKACSGGWSVKQLERFLDKRNVAWQRLVGEGAIPAWLVSWVRMAQALPAAAQPDYQAFRDLIAAGEAEAAAAAAAAAKAAAGGRSAAPWEQAEE